MTLRDFRDFLGEPLRLPIMGKTYTVPPVNARDGIYLSLLIDKIKAIEAGDPDPDLEVFDDDSEKDLYKRALGTLYDELIEDNVPLAALRLAGMVAFADFAHGRAHAEAMWNSLDGGPSGETVAAPNRAARRAATKTRSGKAGAAANATKKRASGSGTKSRPAPSPQTSPDSEPTPPA